MSRIDAAPSAREPIIDRTERTGNIGLLIFLAVALVTAAGAFAFMSREQAEPYVLALLGVLAVIGVFSLFAGAIGLIKFAGKSQNHALAKAFLDSMSEGTIVVDADGRIVYANKSYADLVGAETPRDVRTVERVFSGDPSVTETVFRLAQAGREGRPASEEIRLGHSLGESTGGARWYRIRVRPFQVEGGGKAERNLTVWRVADITRDRDEQENSFQELQRAIDFLDHAPAGFFSADASGRLLYINATLADWLGYDLAQFDVGSIMLADIVQGDGTVLFDSISGEPGKTVTELIDLDLVKRNGQSLPVRLMHRVPFGTEGLRGESRTLVLNRSPGEDISESLRAAEVRFTRFFNNTPIAIASVDRQGRIGRTNAPFMRLFGEVAKAEAGAPAHLTDVVAEENRERLGAALAAAGAGKGEIPPFDVALEGNKNRFVRFYVSAVEEGAHDADVDSEAEAAIVYALETTEQRALEAQFAQSQKMQAIGQLAGGVAHDFNNMLTAIIGFSDLLLASHRPSDPAFQDIMNIKQNANRAAGLVRQLLAFSRRQTLRPQVLELGEVMTDLSVLLDRLLGEQVQLKVVHGRDLWPVMADLNQFEQVIINLAVNARDAMEQSGTLTIRTSNVGPEETAAFDFQGLPDAEFVRIEVIDTGTGMPPEVMEKIFEPFFSTKEVGKGTGLGLSTVYGIVKQTGGYVYPESEVGKGTTFNIFLPRHVEEAVPAETRKQVAEAPQLSDLTGDATILLVEDEEAVRAFAARALASRGYTVHEASSGSEALEVLDGENGAVDLVVSDVVMPEMDGPSLLRELRKRRPDLKIIFVSGYAEDAFAKNLPENEKFGFLPKPFTLKQLATAVKEALGQ
ncbi:two-component system cell cycle sensor histidine kinase/response regulator CckA [Rhodobium orientis]|uniref:histidine kinase n=1 Tax=Rhodobium orientis TaxID=34017 RepID=A0A327JE12_9HYPH|nr:response regulator [Rhodobium orientis]MBB4301805.1 two-component system cell cycle sensor histidine kinase/response regulator CckA [Rhodobium orientis]MBK5950603.1 hybrid sensor histidine kinase/response regulator [Rhodobium orientis]RAI24559.1 hybrid sensor histidine kinase/response regulator [Rhodobium orientis]